jgi:hypothetical protein
VIDPDKVVDILRRAEQPLGAQDILRTYLASVLDDLVAAGRLERDEVEFEPVVYRLP